MNKDNHYTERQSYFFVPARCIFLQWACTSHRCRRLQWSNVVQCPYCVLRVAHQWDGIKLQCDVSNALYIFFDVASRLRSPGAAKRPTPPQLVERLKSPELHLDADILDHLGIPHDSLDLPQEFTVQQKRYQKPPVAPKLSKRS